MKKFHKLFLLSILSLTLQTLFAGITSVNISTKDVSCNGATDGYVTIDSISATAPSGPYIITITTTPIQTIMIGDTVFGLSQGNFTIRVSDIGDPSQVFPFNQNVFIGGPLPLISNIAANPASCFGVCDGQAFVQALQGTPPYTFLWDDPASSTTSSITMLCPGMYNVTVTDNNGCTTTNNETVTQPSQVVPGVTVSMIDCNGATATATSMASGGTGMGYNYSWSNTPGNNTPIENGLVGSPSGVTYTVTITDSDGCVGIESFTVTEPNSIVATITTDSVDCFGDATGSASASITGGTTPYTYTWSGTGTVTGSSVSDLVAGSYNVTVEDMNGCMQVEPFIIGSETELIVSLDSTDVDCNGNSTGSVSITISGASPNYSFVWSDGVIGTNIATGVTSTNTGLPAATYRVTVTDDLGCQKIDSIVVNEPSELLLAIDSDQNPTCVNGMDGLINITATGGAGGYTYLWNDASTSEDRTGLGSGNYSVVVTDANMCTAIARDTLRDPAPVLPNVTTADTKCKGGADGTATASPTGGSGTYNNYMWSTGSPNNTATETGLSQGNYTVTVIDSDGCMGIEAFTINEPAVAFTITITENDVSCSGGSDGSAVGSGSGGATPYNFMWSAGTAVPGPGNGSTTTGLSANTYMVTATDANGCEIIQPFTIGEINPIVITLDSTDVDCNGNATGSITASFTDGTPNYSFMWSNGISGTNVTPGTQVSNPTLVAGTYRITVTDANGCAAIDSITVNEPTDLVVTVDLQIDPLCNGDANGSISITALGGTPGITGYTYLWNDGPTVEDRSMLAAGTYSVIVTDANGCTETAMATLNDPTLFTAVIDSSSDVSCNGQNDGFARVLANGGTGAYTYNWGGGVTTAANSNLSPGSYIVTVTDANGCSETATANISEPAVLTVTTGSTPASCSGFNDGTATATAIGGTGIFTYQWDDVPGMQTSQTATGLTSGTYNVTVTDERGCTATAPAIISQPNTITLDTAKTPLLCNGDSTATATVTVVGGTGTLTYQWDDNPRMQTTATATDLPTGRFTVTVTDANGCNGSISVTIIEPSAVVATITAFTNPSCDGVADGTATAMGSGGTEAGTYDFLWSDNQTTQTAVALVGGTYIVTVTDDNGCTDTASVTITNPALLTAVIDSSSDVSCNGQNDGFTRVLANGGTGAFTYNWGGGNIAASNSNLAPGNYIVTVTDANGCSETATATIIEPSALSVTTTTTPASCSGLNDGTATANATGGTGMFTYQWDDVPGMQTTLTATGLVGGTYNVTVTDGRGCTATAPAIVTQPTTLVLDSVKTSLLCNGDSTATATVTVVGGTGMLTYQWDDTPRMQTTPTATALPAGRFTVTVTDANGCNESINITIIEPTAVVAVISSSTSPTCNGIADGTATAMGSGGTEAGTYDFLWSDNQTTQTAVGLAGGNYIVTVTDDNGCTDTASIILTNPPSVIVSVINQTDVDCFGANTGSLNLDTMGGVQPFVITWMDGPTSLDRTSLSAGTYMLMITDARGCIVNETYMISEPGSGLTATFDSTDVTCNGLSDGNAKINVIGGTAPYVYNWAGTPMGNSSDSIFNLIAGTYKVTVTDDNGCTIIDSTIINEPTPIIISVNSKTDVLCNGDLTGSATVSALGGDGGPYNFQWNDAANTNNQTVSNLGAGMYNVIATDGNMCTAALTVTITESDTLRPTLAIYGVSCGVPNNGRAAVNATGGFGPYNYTWSPTITAAMGAGTDSVFNLTAGMYSVTVIDNNGCDSIQNFTISTVGSAFVFNDSIVNDSCFGDANGYLEILSISGGIAPYNYIWSRAGETTSFVNNLIAGNYSVTITDATGCDSIANFVITEPDILALTFDTTDVSCNGLTNGSAKVTVIGGTAPFTFDWSGTPNGDGTDSISNLAIGTYYVTITDNNNCTVVDSTSINTAPSIMLTIIAQNDVSCNGLNDGGVTVSATGGNGGPYSFQWNNAPTNTIGSTISNLAPGTYTVVATDANLCTGSTMVSIMEPDTLKPSLILKDVGCTSTMDGFAVIKATGGAGMFTYNWNPNAVSGQGTDSIFNLTVGSYSVTVTDINGCDSIQSFTINQSNSAFTYSDSLRNDSCGGSCNGYLEIIGLAGGTAPYNYSWSRAGETTSFIGNLCAGNYTVTVSDFTGCDSVINYTITEPNAITASIATVPDTCIAGVGSATVMNVLGGTTPYSFSWPNAGTGTSVNGLSAATYNLTITDANLCQTILPFTIGNVAPFVINLTTFDVTCMGLRNGEILVSTTGATNPVTYDWADSRLSGANPTNVFAGTYDITVTDANGCAAIDTVTIVEPDELIINSLNTVGESCIPGSDGTATASVSGGTFPYLYDWGNGQVSSNTIGNLVSGNYRVTVQDANFCNIVESFIIGSVAPFRVDPPVTTDVSCNGGMDGTITLTTLGATPPLTYNWNPTLPNQPNHTGLVAGIYQVTITDATMCSETSVANVLDADPIKIVFDTIQDESCSPGMDGFAKVLPTEGVAPYSYMWSTNVIDGAGTDSAFNLAADFYQVTITDANMCTKIANTLIKAASNVDANPTPTQPTCFNGTDGSLTLAASGGVAPYTYLWFDGTTGPIINNLSAGNHAVTITDASNPPCVKPDIITLDQPAPIGIIIGTTVEGCIPSNNATAIVNTSGGIAPFTFAFSGGTVGPGNNQLNSLSGGNYTVTVSDARGCSRVEPFIINTAQNFTLSLLSVDPTCANGSDGEFLVQVNGGVDPLVYNWTGGLSGADPKNASAGNYDIVVTDVYGCTASGTGTLVDRAEITATFSIIKETCNPGNDGEIIVTPSNGQGNYTYQWPGGTAGATSNERTNLTAGTYDLTITDDSMCVSILPFIIGNTAPFTFVSKLDSVSCANGNDGAIDLTVTNNIGAITYNWSANVGAGNITSQDQVNLFADTYSVTVTDAGNNCIETETFEVYEPDTLQTNPVITLVGCNPAGNDGAIDLNAIGGTTPYTFDWGGGITSEDRTMLTVGTYTVTITDANLCGYSETFQIFNQPNVNMVLTSTEVPCTGLMNGTATVASTNANSPVYSWSNGTSIIGTTQTISNLNGGKYYVTVTDPSTTCFGVDSITVIEATPLITTFVISDENCVPGMDGAVTASTTGGTPSYFYIFSGGNQVFNTSTGLTAGTYTVRISDGNNCAVTESFIVNSAASFTVTATTTNPVCAGDSTGTANLVVSPTSVPPTFMWPAGSVPNTTMANQSGLAAGTYIVTVTDPGNGCEVSTSIVITQPDSIKATAVIIAENCNPGMNGSIEITTTGGDNGPYSYMWTGSGISNPTAEDQFNLTAGKYFVTITDGLGCFGTDSFTVRNIITTVPNLTTLNDGCSLVGLCAGQAAVSPTGGVSPYTFAWAGPNGTPINSTMNSINSLCGGDYTVTITDASGCDTIVDFTINARRTILPNTAIVNESCNIDNDGQASVTPAGGAEPYSYAWANSTSIDSVRTGLAPGIYTVTITDATGCDTIVNANVGTEQFDYTFTKIDLSCSGLCDGSVDVVIAGGNTGYTFTWDPVPPTGAGTANISNLCDGLYRVTITRNDNGCTLIDQIQVNPTTPIRPNETFVNESCNATGDGSIILAPTGGAGGYTYTWSPNVSTTATATGLVGGIYNITVTDASSCDTSISVTIQQGNILTGSVLITNNVTCNTGTACDGSAQVNVTGGSLPYSYDWGNGITLATPDSAVGICPGSYSVIVTDATGCSSSFPYFIVGPTPIVPNFNNSNSTCNISNGILEVAPSGGTSPYTVEWYDAMGISVGTTNTVSMLNSGAYSIVITDVSNCVDTFSTSINDIGAEIITASFTDVNCFRGNDGTATVSFTCTDPGCTVEWFSVSTMAQVATSNNATGLTAGDYYVEVTNNSGCKAIENITISEPNQYQIFATITNNLCGGGINGSVNLNVSGGTGTYTYSWSPTPNSGQGTSSISGLAANTYLVTISDGNACDSVMSFTITEPATIVSTFVSTKSNCNQSDGRIVATVMGGTITADYDYQWFNGSNVLLAGQNTDTLDNVPSGSYSLRVRDDNICERRFNVNLSDANGPTLVIDSINNAGCFGESKGAIFITATGDAPFIYNWLPNGETNEDINNLSAGAYSVQVTDVNGCKTNVSDTVRESSQLMATISRTDALCGECNGTSSIGVSGGTAPYTYLWSNGSTLNNADSLCGGTYSVVVSDANGCSRSFDFGINTVGGPTGETVTITAASCANTRDGSVTVLPIGGTPPYTYIWQHNSNATSNTLNNLAAGTYFLQYSDVRSCSRVVQVEITSPTAIQINKQVVGVTCGGIIANGSIDLIVSGGLPPYSYNWGSTTIQDTSYISGLNAGIFNVTVTDANGCAESRVITVSNTGAPASVTPTVGNISCFGTCDGTLTSNILPSMPIDFQWKTTQGVGLAALNRDVIGLCAGTYILEVTTNPLGCKSYFTTVITQPDSITLSSSIVKEVSCTDDCDGEIFINTRGGNILYTYSWSDPNSQQQIPAFGLCPGPYSVTATDANGCTATTSVTLTNPPLLILDITSNTDLICSSDCDATATSVATGGSQPYDFTWSPGGQKGANPINLCFGPNVLTVTDARNCSVSKTVNISAIDTVITEFTGPSVICDGDLIVLDGMITGSSITSSGWYLADATTLLTSSEDTSFSRPPGNYTYYLIALSGSCSDTAKYDITVSVNPIVGLADELRLFGEDEAVLELTNEDPSYSYLWSPDTALNDATAAEPVTSIEEDIIYRLLVTDTNGCVYKDSINIFYSPNIDIPSGFTPNGDGVNDTWNIRYLAAFPDASVSIFNRWGELLYEQNNGYLNAWDGKYKGKKLPIGTYYYIIDLKDDRFKGLTGPVTIVK